MTHIRSVHFNVGLASFCLQRQAVAKMLSKLKWHENVRDFVSSAIGSDMQNCDAVPLVPDWLILEGPHIDSESE